MSSRITNVSIIVSFQADPDPQIQSKLGNYHLVKHLLDEPKRLIGIDGIPQSPAPSPTSPAPSAHKSGVGGRNCSPSSGQEFKKPGGLRGSSASSSSSAGGSSAASHQQRGGFVKPADGKPPYGGRGGYPGQPVKHGGGSNDHRNHGLLPAKGPPPHLPPALVGSNGSLPIIGNSGGSVVGGNFVGGLASRTQFAGRLKLIDVNVSIDFCILSLSLPFSLPLTLFARDDCQYAAFTIVSNTICVRDDCSSLQRNGRCNGLPEVTVRSFRLERRLFTREVFPEIARFL